MKKLFTFIFLLSTIVLAACSSRSSSTTQEPIEMFMFGQDCKLFVFTDKESFELCSSSVSDLSTFLNSPYAKAIEKVIPVFLIDEEDKKVSASLTLYVRADNLTEKQRSELLKTFMFQQTTEVLKNKLQQRYGISAQFDIYDVIYEARGVSRQYENRDELLAKYKLAKPIMATVDRYYGSKIDTSYSDNSESVNPLVILTAPLWIPFSLLDCFNERNVFLDFCPFR